MRKFTLLTILSMIILTGCGKKDFYDENYEARHQRSEQWGTGINKTYDLTVKQYAKLYNSGLEKRVKLGGTNDSFTFVIPQYFEEITGLPKSQNKCDFVFSIGPAGTYVDEDGNKIKNRIICTYEYVADKNVDSYKVFPFLDCIEENEVSETDYTGDDYAAYVSDYEARCSEAFPSSQFAPSAISLTGRMEPILCEQQRAFVKYDDVTYTLPVYVMRVKVNGGFLYLHTYVDMMGADLFDSATYASLCTDGKLDKAVITALAEGQEMFDQLREQSESLITDFVLYGDFSAEYSGSNTPTKLESVSQDDLDEQTPTTTQPTTETFETEASGDDDANDTPDDANPVEDAVSDAFEQYRELQSEDKQEPSDNVIDSVVDEEDSDGYDGYDTDGDAVFD